MNCPCLETFLHATVNHLRQSTGWRRIWVAFALGVVMALAMPPFDFFPLLFVCFPALVFMLQGTANGRQAFITGWAFAFGFLVAGLYWIAVSMFVDLEHFWWAVPLAVAGLPALFAIYYGIAALIARKMGMAGIRGAVNLGLMWFLADFARGHLFTGFPWNLIGYAWSGVLPILQITSLMGIYGLTFLTIVAACLPSSLFSSSKHARLACYIALGGFILVAIGGEIRLQTTTVGEADGVHLRLIQPNIAQSLKWRYDERAEGFKTLLDLSSAPAKSGVQPTDIFWPETASTYYLSEDPDKRQDIATRISGSTHVLTGVIRRELGEDGNTRFYNSLVVVDSQGRLVGGYDKAHLVPFGEYMPWRKYIPFKALAASESDFSSGPGARSLRVLGLPVFSPLICYEAIFPGEVVDENDRPEFIANITNDAWYGNTTGPYQHFAIVRVRAIEEGLPLVRVANTGISGVIDPLGRITKSLGLGKEGYIDTELPTALPQTFYSRWKDVPLHIEFLLLFLSTILSKPRRKVSPAPANE